MQGVKGEIPRLGVKGHSPLRIVKAEPLRLRVSGCAGSAKRYPKKQAIACAITAKRYNRRTAKPTDIKDHG